MFVTQCGGTCLQATVPCSLGGLRAQAPTRGTQHDWKAVATTSARKARC